MATTENDTTSDPLTGYADASTQRVTAENGIEYAYRDLGRGGVPLVVLQHFRGNLDNWDPALVDALAAERRVVAFDNVGVGATTGTTPNTVEAMAHDAIAIVEAMGLERVDLLGFSIGSFVAQEIALIRPDLPRRVVLASSAPRGAAGMHGWAPDVIGAIGAPETSPQGYLGVFFAPTDTSRDAGQQAIGRIFGRNDRPRRADDLADPPGPVPRSLRLGHPQPLAAPTRGRDRSAGLRRQRRQRPHDPAPLLLAVGGASPRRPSHHLPGLGPRLPLPALQPLRSFANDIKPLVREKDRSSMLGRFDLWSYQDVRDNAPSILEVLRAGTMPCDGPWSPDHVDLFGRWIAGGMVE
jgi:pimeloyl-ACP methyl ester carboxylesterase